MNIIRESELYIATHVRNIGEDTIQHLEAFAALLHQKATAEVAKVESDVSAEVKTVDTKVETEVKTVESALEEIKEHSETAFADLLKSQSEAKEST